jgi:hypothetical protein
MSTEPAGGTISGNSTDTNTITDQQLFDHAVTTPDPAPAAPSGGDERPDAMPSPGPSSADAPASTRPDLQQPQQQPRTPQGQFAPKPKAEQQAPQQGHNVPLAELLKERDARQRLEAHAAELTRAVMELQQRFNPQQPQQPQQPQGPQTIFDDPDTYLQQRVMEPLRQEGQMYIMKVRDDLSREQANMQYGAQEVNAALTADRAIRHTPQGNFVFNQIMQHGHPYGQLVQWHRTTRMHAAIGADPQAWLQQQQKTWAENEKVQDYVAELRAKRLAQQGRPQNVVQLPPSLSSVRSSSGRMDNGGDLSSASLYDFATK